MNRKKPYRHLDIPKVHLAVGEHFVSPKARDPQEIADRRQRPSGALLTRNQHRGAEIAAAVLRSVDDEENISFVRRIIPVAGINTAWYSSAQNASDVQRRITDLPLIAVEEDPWQPDADTLLESARNRFDTVASLAGGLVVATETCSPKLQQRRKQFGRFVGSSSLILACSDLGDKVIHGTAFDVQEVVRQRSLRVLEDARTMHQEIGSHPSLAGLADPDSDISVYWRRNAPSGAYEALESATSQVAA